MLGATDTSHRSRPLSEALAYAKILNPLKSAMWSCLYSMNLLWLTWTSIPL